MRKLLLGILILVVVLIGVAVALPFLLPRDMIKAEVERRVTAELGREFRIEGPLELRPWRPFRLELNDVRLANPDWAESPNLAEIARVDLEVDALAYFSGTIALERLLVEEPTFALERREDGTASWDFPALQGDDDGDSGGGGGDGLADIRLGEIRVTGGEVSFDDRASGEARSFSAIELWARGDPAAPGILVDASVESGGERATINGAIGDLNALLAGEPSTVSLDADLPGFGLAAEGEASPTGSAVLAIDVEATPRRLMDWVGQPLTLPEGTLDSLKVALDVEAMPDGVGLRALTLEVDELEVTGNLDLALADRPKLTGSLDLGVLDLRPYLPAKEAAEDDEESEAPSAEGDAGWPTEPLDLPLPLPLDIDLALAFTSLATPEIELGAGRLQIEADSTVTALTIEELALYEGGLAGKVALSSGETLGLEAGLEAAGVQLQPLLQAVADIDRFAGTGNVKATVKSQGGSVDELVRNLAGDGAVLARDGAILGINIAATIRQVTSLGAADTAAAPQRTDFAEAGGTFTIEGGVLQNEDFALRAPVLRVSGDGSVDLGEKTLDYHLVPRLATTIQGQDANTEGAFQAGVPLAISGPWADPDIGLDIEGVLSGDLGDPAAIAETVRNLASDPAALGRLEEQLGIQPGSPLGSALEGVGSLLGNRQEGEAPAELPEPGAGDATGGERKDPLTGAIDTLQSIFGR